MNTMHSVLGILILFVFNCTLIAQTANNNLSGEFVFKKVTEGPSFLNDQRLSDIQGSPYLDKKFIPGKIFTTSGATFQDIPLRYNMYTDELEFIKDNITLVLTPKSIVKRAEFGGVIFSGTSYNSGPNIQSGLFQILTEGNATLLIRFTIHFFEKEEAKGYSGPKPARFDAATTQYFLSFKGAPAELISSKNRLLEMFGDKKSEMKTYISKNKLSVKNKEELTGMIAYFNSL